MAERTHLAVFGATGFTAKAVIRELVGRGSTWLPADFTWALAGRNTKNLEAQAAALEDVDGIPRPSVVFADVQNTESLFKMAQSTKRACAIVLATRRVC